MHADVADVGQRYILDASKLRDRPRKLLSTTGSVVLRRCPEDLLRAFSELPFSSSQVPFRRSID